MAQAKKLGKITFSSLSLPEQLQLDRMQDNINTLAGHNGTIELANDVSLGGTKITNVGAAQSPKDVVTSEVAEENYSAKALRPHLEGGGKASLRTYITGLQGDVTASGPGIAQAAVRNVTGVTFTQITGNLALSQLPVTGATGTVTLAKLTPTGTNGSLSVQNGLIVAIVNPT